MQLAACIGRADLESGLRSGVPVEGQGSAATCGSSAVHHQDGSATVRHIAQARLHATTAGVDHHGAWLIDAYSFVETTIGVVGSGANGLDQSAAQRGDIDGDSTG